MKKWTCKTKFHCSTFALSIGTRSFWLPLSQFQSTWESNIFKLQSSLSIRVCKVWILWTKECISWHSSHNSVLPEVFLQWYQIGAKRCSNLSNVVLLFDITERKSLVEEGQMMHSYYTNALESRISTRINQGQPTCLAVYVLNLLT